jgi:hypothetical protein
VSAFATTSHPLVPPDLDRWIDIAANGPHSVPGL